MRRVNVIGSTGSGKTTLARCLARRLDVRYIELDAINWGPGWTMIEADEFQRRVDLLTSEGGWVVDGNYTSRLGELVMRRADTLVWLDLPLHTILWRIVRRTLARIRTGEELWGGDRENVRNAFFSRESLLLFAIRTYSRRRRIFAERFADPAFAQLQRLRFRSARDADRWLASL